jgi:hypothetical protein
MTRAANGKRSTGSRLFGEAKGSEFPTSTRQNSRALRTCKILENRT